MFLSLAFNASLDDLELSFGNLGGPAGSQKAPGGVSLGGLSPPRILGCFQVSIMMFSAKYLDVFSTVLGCGMFPIQLLSS